MRNHVSNSGDDHSTRSRAKSKKGKFIDSSSSFPFGISFKKSYSMWDRMKLKIWRNLRFLILLLLSFVFYHSVFRDNPYILSVRSNHSFRENKIHRFSTFNSHLSILNSKSQIQKSKKGSTNPSSSFSASSSSSSFFRNDAANPLNKNSNSKSKSETESESESEPESESKSESKSNQNFLINQNQIDRSIKSNISNIYSRLNKNSSVNNSFLTSNSILKPNPIPKFEPNTEAKPKPNPIPKPEPKLKSNTQSNSKSQSDADQTIQKEVSEKIQIDQVSQVNGINQIHQVKRFVQVNEVKEVNQFNESFHFNQNNGINQVNGVNKVNKDNQVNQNYGVDQIIKENKDNLINQNSQNNEFNRINKVNQVNEDSEGNDVSQVNKVKASEAFHVASVGEWSHGTAFKGSKNRLRLSSYSKKRKAIMTRMPRVMLTWQQSIVRSLFPGRKDLRDSNEFFVCDKGDRRSDVCMMRGDIRMNAKKRVLTLYAEKSTTVARVEKVQPYPRKWEDACMQKVRTITMRSVHAHAHAHAHVHGDVDHSNVNMKKILNLDHEEEKEKEKEKEKERGGMEGNKDTEGDNETNDEDDNDDYNDDDDAKDANDTKLSSEIKLKSKHKLQPHRRVLMHKDKKRNENKKTMIENDESNDVILCNVYHHVPAILISLGGHTGNLYHDFHDGLIPLFIAIQHLKGEVVFIVVQDRVWWWMKYESIARQLSNYPPVFLEQSDENVHCFAEVVVGVKVHDELAVNPSLMPNRETIRDFQEVLHRAWFGWEKCSCRNSNSPKPPLTFVRDCRPQITIIARNDTRRILNQRELTNLAYRLGFKVLTLYPMKTTNLQDVWADLRESEVMIGVHGAAMTHFLFMRPKTIFVQIIPLGCKWSANAYYGEPSLKLGLKYIPYHIDTSESSLNSKYPPDHRALTKIDQMMTEDWSVIKKTYLDDQDVILNLKKFETVLLKAKKMIVEDRGSRERIVKVFKKRKCEAKEWRTWI